MAVAMPISPCLTLEIRADSSDPFRQQLRFVLKGGRTFKLAEHWFRLEVTVIEPVGAEAAAAALPAAASPSEQRQLRTLSVPVRILHKRGVEEQIKHKANQEALSSGQSAVTGISDINLTEMMGQVESLPSIWLTSRHLARDAHGCLLVAQERAYFLRCSVFARVEVQYYPFNLRPVHLQIQHDRSRPAGERYFEPMTPTFTHLPAVGPRLDAEAYAVHGEAAAAAATSSGGVGAVPMLPHPESPLHALFDADQRSDSRCWDLASHAAFHSQPDDLEGAQEAPSAFSASEERETSVHINSVEASLAITAPSSCQERLGALAEATSQMQQALQSPISDDSELRRLKAILRDVVVAILPHLECAPPERV